MDSTAIYFTGGSLGFEQTLFANNLVQQSAFPAQATIRRYFNVLFTQIQPVWTDQHGNTKGLAWETPATQVEDVEPPIEGSELISWSLGSMTPHTCIWQLSFAPELG